eukprot:832787-Pelagomonas_calceolata.AAC.4
MAADPDAPFHRCRCSALPPDATIAAVAVLPWQLLALHGRILPKGHLHLCTSALGIMGKAVQGEVFSRGERSKSRSGGVLLTTQFSKLSLKR